MKVQKFITKTLLVITLAISFLMLLDNLLPTYSKEETITGADDVMYGRHSGSANNRTYTLITKSFKFELPRENFFQVGNEFPLTLYYSPIWHIVKRIRTRSVEEPHKIVDLSTNRNIFTIFLLFPVAAFICSVLGFYVKENSDSSMLVSLSIAILAMIFLFFMDLI